MCVSVCVDEFGRCRTWKASVCEAALLSPQAKREIYDLMTYRT